MHRMFLLLLFVQAVYADDRPNILFCITDDQSWIHTSFAGDPVVKTPGFDRVARTGLYFENAFTNCPSCAPSRASVLTGQKFWRLEEGGLLFGRLKKKFPIITDTLQNAGYEVGITGKGYSPANQSFESTWNPIFTKQVSIRHKVPQGISSINYFASFEKFLDGRDEKKPFFFWFGAYEPHRSYKYGIGEENGIDINKIKVPPFFPDSQTVRNDIADYMYEIQWQDAHLVKMLDLLEKKGELNNTIVVVTSDNGMPFPRAKATAYNYGVHLPLAIMWGDKIKGGRSIKDFVNHDDFAPTFLEAAGLPVQSQMSGKSLMNILKSAEEGQVDKSRSFTVSGLERHVWARPDGATYGRRVIHTEEFAYIRNYNPERWPMGGPDFKASHQGTFGDIDAGPTKSFMMKHKDDASVKALYGMSFEKLPAEELYNIKNDPAQMKNLAEDPKYAEIKKQLIEMLDKDLLESGDPRAKGLSPWDAYPFYAGTKYLKGKYLDEVKNSKKGSK